MVSVAGPVPSATNDYKVKTTRRNLSRNRLNATTICFVVLLALPAGRYRTQRDACDCMDVTQWHQLNAQGEAQFSSHEACDQLAPIRISCRTIAEAESHEISLLQRYRGIAESAAACSSGPRRHLWQNFA